MRALILWLCLALPVLASPAGRDDPAFRAALDAWLAGDEATALPALAVLATGGNAEAQILLARIDTNAVWQGAWLRKLPRDQRIALMRRPGGLSGQPWMQVAAAAEPRAALWHALGSVEAAPGIIAAFAAAGEPAAAAMAARTLALRRVPGLAGAGLPPVLAPFGAADGTPGPLGLPDLSGHPMIAALCAQACSGDALCSGAVYGAIGGYLGAISLGPPSEVMVPTVAFSPSPMGLATTRRAMRRMDPASDLACLRQN